jgi:hypothetical protein
LSLISLIVLSSMMIKNPQGKNLLTGCLLADSR